MMDQSLAKAIEETTLERLSVALKTFYENPRNVEAYKKWKKEKETNHANHNHGRDDRTES